MTDKDAALASMFRALKPGGRLLIPEFSKPVFEPFSKLYDPIHSLLYRLWVNWLRMTQKSYKYLAESIRMHPDQRTLKGMMEMLVSRTVTITTLLLVSLPFTVALNCKG